MPRRKKVQKRVLLTDAKYKSTLVTKFINYLFRKGKRSVGERIVYKALGIIEKRTGENGLDIFVKAVENVKPLVEVKSRRVGGATYQVPVEVRYDRQLALSMRWIISFAKARSENTMMERLAREIEDASNNQGSAIKKREETHRMAEANKAFAHFR